MTTGAIRRDRAPSASPLLLLAGAVVAGVTLVPLGWVVWSTAQLGLGDAVDFLARPRVGLLLWNTVRLLVATVALSAVLGVGCAWLVERSGVRSKGLWHGLMAAPLAVPAFVNGYGWVSTTHAVQSYPGAVMVVTLSYFPLVYLPTVATLRRVDPGLEEVAAALGRRPWGVFFRVVLPTISPGVLGGCLLVGLHVLGEYGALQLLNYPTLTTSILDQFRSTFNGPAAALLAAVLAAFCVVLAALELYAAGRRRRARVGAGAPRTGAATSRSPWPARVGGVVLPAVALLALAVPLGSLVRWMVRGTSTSFPAGDLGAATLSTVGLALAAGVLAAVAAAPLAWLAVRHRGWPAMFLERSTYIASSLPGIVVALALVTVTIRLLPGAVPDPAGARGRLRDPVPAPCGGLAPVHPRARAARARGRRAQPRLRQPGDGPPGDAAARAARRHVRRRPRRPRGLDRADRDAAAGADRGDHAVHGVLGPGVGGRVRRRRAVRAAAGGAVRARHVAAQPARHR